jgi:hypothetical protein
VTAIVISTPAEVAARGATLAHLSGARWRDFAGSRRAAGVTPAGTAKTITASRDDLYGVNCGQGGFLEHDASSGGMNSLAAVVAVRWCCRTSQLYCFFSTEVISPRMA